MAKKPIEIKLIKIDPHTQTVTDETVTFQSDDEKLKFMQEYCCGPKGGYVEGYVMPGGKDQMIADEDARMKPRQPMFLMQGGKFPMNQPVIGKAIIVGLKSGSWASTKVTADEIRPFVKWAK
jgi:hypothetical protein